MDCFVASLLAMTAFSIRVSQSSNIFGGLNPPNSRSINSASFRGVRSSSQGPTICTPTGNPSGGRRDRGGRQAGQGGDAGPGEPVGIDVPLAVDEDAAGFLVGGMIVRIGRRRHHRADHRVKRLEQFAPRSQARPSPSVISQSRLSAMPRSRSAARLISSGDAALAVARRHDLRRKRRGETTSASDDAAKSGSSRLSVSS
jgi:hypothetical protein